MWIDYSRYSRTIVRLFTQVHHHHIRNAMLGPDSTVGSVLEECQILAKFHGQAPFTTPLQHALYIVLSIQTFHGRQLVSIIIAYSSGQSSAQEEPHPVELDTLDDWSNRVQRFHQRRIGQSRRELNGKYGKEAWEHYHRWPED